MKNDVYIPLIFKVITFILLVSCLVGVLVDSSYEFQGTTTLLKTLSTAPVMDSALLLDLIPSISADWGLFNWFRDFLNLFVSAINLLIFFGGNMLNVLIYVFYFLKDIFNFA